MRFITSVFFSSSLAFVFQLLIFSLILFVLLLHPPVQPNMTLSHDPSECVHVCTLESVGEGFLVGEVRGDVTATGSSVLTGGSSTLTHSSCSKTTRD